MSENPPGIGPPLQYSNYPRGQGVYGSPERLQALSDGYFGLNLVFGLNVVLVIAARAAQLAVASSSTVDPATMLLVICVSLGVIGFAVGFCTYPFNKKIGYGCGWSQAGPVIASVLMGLNSAFCWRNHRLCRGPANCRPRDQAVWHQVRVLRPSQEGDCRRHRIDARAPSRTYISAGTVTYWRACLTFTFLAWSRTEG